MRADGFQRRLQATAAIACLAMAGGALAFLQARFAVAVLAGGLLVGYSYWSIGYGVAAIDPASGARGRPRVSWMVAKVLTRYALLALLAYVMIARLRLHPLGLLAGASSVVVAASIEAFRLLLKKS